MAQKDILADIVANKKIEMRRQKEAVELRSMLSLGSDRLDRVPLSMKNSLAGSSSGIIAEFKRRSPSKGWIYPAAKVEEVVPEYEQGGASACSILTDGDFFGGSLGDLKRARPLVNIPLLRKDFIIDPYQLYQARVMGADAVLLIAACLSIEECRKLAETAHSLQLETLLEIHTEEELDYLTPHIDMLGVNNRHLGTFHTDVENSFRLIEKMEEVSKSSGNAPVMVSESGISAPETVYRLREKGFRGFLIGENFMKTGEPGKSLSDFITPLNSKG